jgi:hypothetical protein
MEDQNEQTVTTRAAGLRYGLIGGVIAIAYFVILTVAGIDMTQGIGRWASLIFTVAIIYFAHKYYKDNGDGYMSIGQGIGIGFWISLVSSFISSTFTFIYIKFIDDTFIQQLLDQSRQSMEESGNGMSDEQIDQAMEMTAKFMTPGSMFIFGIIGGLVIGLIVAVIVSLITQKKNPSEAI